MSFRLVAKASLLLQRKEYLLLETKYSSINNKMKNAEQKKNLLMAGTLGRMTLPPSWSNDRNGAAFISCICKRFILLLQKRTSHFQVCISQQKGKPIKIAIRCKIRMKEAFISHCLDSKNLLEQKQMKNLRVHISCLGHLCLDA